MYKEKTPDPDFEGQRVGSVAKWSKDGIVIYRFRGPTLTLVLTPEEMADFLLGDMEGIIKDIMQGPELGDN